MTDLILTVRIGDLSDGVNPQAIRNDAEMALRNLLVSGPLEVDTATVVVDVSTQTEDPMVSRIELPDGEIRIWEPNVHENDLGRMYVLDVLGLDVLIRERDDEVYVHVDTTDADSTRPGDKLVAYEVNNTGDNLIGGG